MRFRTGGINWTGQPWMINWPTRRLAELVETVWPNSQPADGTVASRRHDQINPTSDHSPDSIGMVRAIDVGVTSQEGVILSEALRESRDPRIKYVIWQDRLFSSYDHPISDPFEWRPYTGAKHVSHVHVSVTGDDWNDAFWNLDLGQSVDDDMAFLPIKYGDGYPTAPSDSDYAGLNREFKQEDVSHIQAIANKLGAGLMVDGVYGPGTVAGVAVALNLNDGSYVNGERYMRLLRRWLA